MSVLKAKSSSSILADMAQQVAAERQLMQAVHEAEEATLPGPEQREARLSGKACEAAAATPLRELTVQAFAPSPPMSISPGVAARSTERTDGDASLAVARPDMGAPSPRPTPRSTSRRSW